MITLDPDTSRHPLNRRIAIDGGKTAWRWL
jgi:hypothetical protein